MGVSGGPTDPAKEAASTCDGVMGLAPLLLLLVVLTPEPISTPPITAPPLPSSISYTPPRTALAACVCTLDAYRGGVMLYTPSPPLSPSLATAYRLSSPPLPSPLPRLLTVLRDVWGSHFSIKRCVKFFLLRRDAPLCRSFRLKKKEKFVLFFPTGS